MANNTVRVGIVGLGDNCRRRHVPGLRACADVQIAAVCNRRRDSTLAAAAEFSIPKTYDRWEELVADPDLDAVLIGTALSAAADPALLLRDLARVPRRGR